MDDDLLEDEKLSREFHLNCLLESVREEFDGPIYQSEEDLEAVQNSDAPTVAVVAEDQPMIFYVPREEFLKDKDGTKADDLFSQAFLP